MFRKIYVFIVLIAFLFMTSCAFCGANGEDIGGGSDEVLVMKKDTPVPVTIAAAVTITASPVVITATAAPVVTTTVKPEATVKPTKKKTPVTKAVKTPAAKNTPVEISPEQQKINRLVAEIKDKQAARKAMTCDVIIKTTAPGAAGPDEVKASVAIKKKDKFMIHYTSPAEQFIVSNGKWLWIYTVDVKQVLKQSAKDAPFDLNFYIEIQNSLEYFVVNSRTTLTEAEKTHTLVMIPKNRKNLDYDEISVIIEKEGLAPSYISMKYEGTLMEVLFANTKNFTAEEAAANPALANSIFEFKTPDGVEEIEASALIDAATE